MKKYDYHYSVTVRCNDLAILYCLRALSMYSQQAGRGYTSWGGTGEDAWKSNNNCVTFRFTRPAYRHLFLEEAMRILPPGSFKEEERKNDDPPEMTEKDIMKIIQ